MIPPLVAATICFALGIAAGIQRPVPEWGGPLLLVLGAAALARSIHPAGAATPRSTRLVLGLALLAGLGAGSQALLAARRSCTAALEPGRRLDVGGMVVARHGDNAQLRLSGIGQAPGAPCDATVRVRLPSTGAAARLEPGTTIEGAGSWWTPPGASGRLSPVGLLTLDSVRMPTAAAAGGIAARVSTARWAAGRAAQRIFGDQAPLARSLLLAQRDGLDRDVRDRYARAGLSHLLAISGLHVGLVAGILLLLAGAARLGRGRAAAAGAAGTVGYVLFLGSPHSAVRAATQIVLVLLGRVLQRPARGSALMAAAALGLLAVEPEALLSPGFQLSFAGVAGLLWLRRPLLARMRSVQRWRPGGMAAGRWIADGVATSLAATLATAPIVAWHFGRIAPIGVLANLVAIPLLGAAIPALGLAMALGTVSLPAARFVAEGGSAMLMALDRVAAIAAAVPGGSVGLPGPVALVVTLGLAAGFLAVRRIGRARPAVRLAAAGGIAMAVLVVSGLGLPGLGRSGPGALGPGGQTLEIHMIDVGQGDAIAIRTPANRWILVDAGGVGEGWDAGEARVVPYLSRRGVLRLEGLVLSHPDADHVGGAESVLRALRPGWIADPAAVVGKGRYARLLRAAADRDVHWMTPPAGAELELDGVTVLFLYPDGPSGAVEDANDASVVIRVSMGRFDALLTGDAPESVEDMLAERHGEGLQAEVLKVGHHGSITSTGDALLEATGARAALISAGADNRYGHPHPAVIERLRAADVQIYRTDRSGSIIVRAGRDGSFEVSTER